MELRGPLHRRTGRSSQRALSPAGATRPDRGGVQRTPGAESVPLTSLSFRLASGFTSLTAFRVAADPRAFARKTCEKAWSSVCAAIITGPRVKARDARLRSCCDVAAGGRQPLCPRRSCLASGGAGRASAFLLQRPGAIGANQRPSVLVLAFAARRPPLFLSSSTVEHPAVNRRVAGSNPA